jgi:hypothetical protein
MGRVAAAKRRSGGWGRAQRQLNGLNNAVEVGIDVRVPEPQRAESRAAKNCIAHGVVISLQVLGVLASIDLNNQTMLEADEIQIEPQQWRLAAEVEPVRPHLTKLNPQSNFLRRHRLA